MRLINFTEELRDRAEDFHRLHPMLQAVICYATYYVYGFYGKSLLWTSFERPNDSGVHGTNPCRGGDADVCDKAAYVGGVLPYEARDIADEVNSRFVYDPTRPGMNIAIYGDLDPKGKHWNHIHFQVHDRTVAI